MTVKATRRLGAPEKSLTFIRAMTVTVQESRRMSIRLDSSAVPAGFLEEALTGVRQASDRRGSLLGPPH